MVKTRSITKKSTRTPAKKKSAKSAIVPESASTKSSTERCQNWIQQQKKEKLRYQPDELNSEGSDDETPEMRLDAISDHSNDDETITKIGFGCEWQRCNRVFDTYELFHKHATVHINAAAANEDCRLLMCDWDLCDFECDDAIVFKRHFGYHIYMTKLKTNGEQLLQKKLLPACMNDSRRRNLVPDMSEKYVCMWDECTYTFDMIEDYFEHARFHCVHEMEINKLGNRNQTVQCQWISCKRTFNLRLKMTDHMRSHTGERFVACSNCGSTCNSYVKFYDHFRRQALTNNYKCAECFQSFNTEELLNNHMYAHVNRFKCTMCDMTCPSTAALTQHVRYRHINDRPFKCTSCDYGAVYKWDLDKHIGRMHSLEPPTYFCEEFDCDFTCTTANLMRKHVRNVHGDGPNVYCCHCCDRRYKCGSSLSRHLKQMHGFQLPSGHRRFTYHIDIDGAYRVQTTRMESLEVSEQIMAPAAQDPATTKPVTYTLGALNATKNGFQLTVMETEAPADSPVPDDTPDETDEHCDQIDVDVEVEVEVKQIPVDARSMNSSEFMESLSLKQLPQSNRRTYSRPAELKAILEEDLDGGGSEHKSIDNFSVIRKYAKKKRIQKSAGTTYTIQEVDEDGNVLESRTTHMIDTDFETID